MASAERPSSERAERPLAGIETTAVQAPDAVPAPPRELGAALVLSPVLAAADELAACLDTDQMLRRAVELARERFGLERVGLWVRDPRAREPILRGTWGTGVRGETTDEHQLAHEFDPANAEQLRRLQHCGALWRREEGMLKGTLATGGKTDLGHGWLVLTPLVAARELVGVMFNDTALSRSGLEEHKQVQNAVFCSLLAGLFLERRSRFPWRAPSARRHSPWLESVLRALEEDPRASGDALARQLSISPGHLARSFKAEMGLSLVEYRHRRLLDRFLCALQRGDGNLLAAALEAGFGSYTQFHRIYKKTFGSSPREHLSGPASPLAGNAR
jgi:AraC-like DNA-binding protein